MQYIITLVVVAFIWGGLKGLLFVVALQILYLVVSSIKEAKQ